MTRTFLVACAASALLPSFASAGPDWLVFNPLPGGSAGGAYQSRSWGISPDGSVVVGVVPDGSYPRAVAWINGQLQLLPTDGVGSSVSDASLDGRLLVGFTTTASGSRMPTVWERVNGGYQFYFLSDLPGGGVYANIHAVSADGTRAVGVGRVVPGRVQAVTWNLLDGPEAAATGLGYLPPWNIDWSEAHAVSSDGAVVAGEGRNTAGALAFSDRLGEISPEPGIHGFDGASSITAMSGDARFMVGYSRTPAFGSPLEPTLWIDGAPQLLPELPELNNTNGLFAVGVSDDGSVIIGRAWDGSSIRAVVWIDLVPRLLSDVLLELGADTTGWQLTHPYGISADGRVITGLATNPQGIQQAFVAVIPAPGAGLLLCVSASACVLLRRR